MTSRDDQFRGHVLHREQKSTRLRWYTSRIRGVGDLSLRAGMKSRFDKAVRLSREVQGKLGEKLALLYVPVLRQRLPRQLAELLARMERRGDAQPRSSLLDKLTGRRKAD
jgi:hypothetical protein